MFITEPALAVQQAECEHTDLKNLAMDYRALLAVIPQDERTLALLSTIQEKQDEALDIKGMLDYRTVDLAMESIATKRLAALTAAWKVIQKQGQNALKAMKGTQATLKALKQKQKVVAQKLSEGGDKSTTALKGFNKRRFRSITKSDGKTVASPIYFVKVLNKMEQALDKVEALAMDNASKDLAETEANALRLTFFEAFQGIMQATDAKDEEKSFNKDTGHVAVFQWLHGLRCVLTASVGARSFMRLTTAEEKVTHLPVANVIDPKTATSIAQEVLKLQASAEALTKKVTTLTPLLDKGKTIVAKAEGHEDAVDAAKEGIAVAITLAHYLSTQSTELVNIYLDYLSACADTYTSKE